MNKDDEEKPPLNKEEATKKIRAAARKGNIRMAEDERVQAHGRFAYEVVQRGFGIKAFIITDWSTAGDFGMDEDDMIRFFETWGVRPVYDDTIVDLCDRLRKGEGYEGFK